MPNFKWEQARRREPGASMDEEVTHFNPNRAIAEITVLFKVKWTDGLTLGVLEAPGLPRFYARWDRYRGVWTPELTDWQIKRISDAWTKELEGRTDG